MARWLENAHASVVQSEYTATLGAGLVHGTPRWLLDVRHRPIPDVQLSEWVTNSWLPQVVAALAPQRPRLAYLISEERAINLQSDATLRARVNAALTQSTAFDIAIFTEEPEALQWLNARP